MSVLNIIYIATFGFVLANALPLNAPSVPLVLVPKNETKDNYQPGPPSQESPYSPQLKVPIGSVLESTPDSPPMDVQGPMPVDVVGINWNKIANRLNLPNFFKDLDFRPVVNETNSASDLGNVNNTPEAKRNESQQLGNPNNPAVSVINGNPQSANSYPLTVSDLSIKLMFFVRNFDPTHDLQVMYEANPKGYEVTYKVVQNFGGGAGYFGGFGGGPGLNPQALKIASG